VDLKDFIREVTALPGLPGYEAEVGRFVATAFEPYADDVSTDVMGNVVARIGREGPRVMISAHQDEIGLMVTDILDDGCLRAARNGGVDPRILPGLEVRVLAGGGPLYGVVGAKPPHLQSDEEKDKALELKDLYIDIGFPAEKVRELIRVGDPIVMLAPLCELSGGRLAGKTMDDRAGVAAMLECARTLARLTPPAQVFCVTSTQEEVGLKGAKTAAYSLDPDFAIAVDVTHGTGPGTGAFEAFPLEKVILTTGPNIHPMLLTKIKETAARHRVEIGVEVESGQTGTDAGAIQLARAGVPCLLVSIPLKYMHTTVETLSLDTVREAGRLMALFIDEISREWEGLVWY